MWIQHSSRIVLHVRLFFLSWKQEQPCSAIRTSARNPLNHIFCVLSLNPNSSFPLDLFEFWVHSLRFLSPETQFLMWLRGIDCEACLGLPK